MDRNDWEKNVGSEIAWWREWLRTKGLDWPDQYSMRCDPNAELSTAITRHLGIARPIDVLDVGSGPMTSLGKKWDGHAINIIACDALAQEYKKLSFSEGLPLVEVVQCDNEKLVERFGEERFDLVHARNTLDHGYDPMQAIRQMVRVAKIGGIVVLDHHPNEATRGNHQGLHQHDFYIDGDRMIINSPGERWDVFAELGMSMAVDILEISGDEQCLVVLRRVGPWQGS